MVYFACILINEAGDKLKISLPEGNLLGMRMLNALCGADPIEWIDHTSHNKIISCTSILKDEILGICKEFVNTLPGLSKVSDFFKDQKENAYLGFLRYGTLERIDDELIEKTIYMIRYRNFAEKYQMLEFGDREVYTGPQNLKDCVCRFCGLKYPEVRFKKRNAHAIPDALGNKLVFCNDECQTCNGDLSAVEKELIEYLKFRRADSRIPNKKKKIIHVTGHNFDYDGPTGILKISKSAILDEKEGKYFVKLEGAELISHLGIYRGLAKIAIDLIPWDLVGQFEATIRWIKGDFIPRNVPDVYFIYRKSAIQQPRARVYLRKSDVQVSEYPKCIVALDLIDLTFVYIVPFSKYDDEMLAPYSVREYLPFFMSNDGHLYEKIDMSDRIGKYAHVKIWVEKCDCEVVGQDMFNSVQERNPNIVDFPPLDRGNVKVLSNVVNRNCLFATPHSYHILIDNCVVRPDFDITVDASSAGLNMAWKVQVEHMHSQQPVLQAEGEIDVMLMRPSDVYSVMTREVSSFLIEYLFEIVSDKLSEINRKRMPDFDFSQLADMIMEAQGHIMHPKEDMEKSVMSNLLDT
jgi:hypothetical protein